MSSFFRAITIDTPNKISLLPEVIASKFVSWEEDIKVLKEEKYQLPYPVKLAKISFIYNEQLYHIEAGAFET